MVHPADVRRQLRLAARQDDLELLFEIVLSARARSLIFPHLRGVCMDRAQRGEVLCTTAELACMPWYRKPECAPGSTSTQRGLASFPR